MARARVVSAITARYLAGCSLFAKLAFGNTAEVANGNGTFLARDIAKSLEEAKIIRFIWRMLFVLYLGLTFGNCQ